MDRLLNIMQADVGWHKNLRRMPLASAIKANIARLDRRKDFTPGSGDPILGLSIRRCQAQALNVRVWEVRRRMWSEDGARVCGPHRGFLAFTHDREPSERENRARREGR